MFDLDISKMALIGVVALVVLGPERLPRVARTAGALLGRAQRYINDVKSEVTREIEIEELRKMKSGFEEAAASVHNTIHDTVREHTDDIANAWNNGGAVAESTAEIAGSSSTAAGIDNNWLARKTPVGNSAPRRNWRVRRSALPVWYKQASLKRAHIASSAAREAKAMRRPEPLAPAERVTTDGTLTASAQVSTAVRRPIRFL